MSVLEFRGRIWGRYQHGGTPFLVNTHSEVEGVAKCMVNELWFINASWTLTRNEISASNEEQWRTAGLPETFKEES